MSSRYTSKQTTVRFEDAAALGMTMGPGPGDLAWGDVNAENAEHIRVTDRGRFDGRVLGDDLSQDCSLTLELKNEAATHATLARVQDFLRKTGSFAAATSIDPTIWAWKCIVSMTDGTTTTTYTFSNCDGGYAFKEGKEGHQISLKWKNEGGVTIA